MLTVPKVLPPHVNRVCQSSIAWLIKEHLLVATPDSVLPKSEVLSHKLAVVDPHSFQIFLPLVYFT